MGRHRAWCVLTVLVFACACAGEDDFNVDLRPGWEGCYRPGEWAPLEVGIATSLKDPFDGTVEVSAQQDSVTTMKIRQGVVVARGRPIVLPMVGKFAFGATQCNLTLRDRDGRVRWEQEFALMNYQPGASRVTPVRGEDLLIGTSGRRGAALAKVAQLTHCDRGSQPGAVYVSDKLPNLLPWDWTGYATLDLLVLPNVDWSLLNAHQAQAIVEYVQGGGKLLLIPGAQPIPTTGPLASLLPFGLRQPRQATLSLEDDSRRRRSYGATAWTFPDKLPRGWRLADPEEPALMAAGPVGLGVVGVLAADPSQIADMTADAQSSLWIACMNKLIDGARIATGASPERSPYYSFNVPDAQSTNAVLQHLLTIPQLRPLNIWYVIGLLALLAIMLGPVDYLVLKKLDRLPWTWVTASGIIALFTVGAYYGVRYVRGGDLQVRAVTVIDSVPGASAWSTTYAGIFAPDSDTYRLAGLARPQWWSAISPSQGEYYYYRGGGESELMGRTIYCRQQDGANLPDALPISIYSMQCMIAESQVPRAPLEAILTQENGRTVLHVVNRLAHPILGLTLRIGERTVPLGGVAAGAEVRLDIDRDRITSEKAMEVFRPVCHSAVDAHGVSRRTAGIERHRAAGAAILTAVYDQPPLANTVEGRPCKNDHFLLARLVLAPALEGQAPTATATQPASLPAVERETPLQR